MLLNNKKAVITGGSDGIGLGIAKAFVQSGADVLLIGRDLEKLKKAAVGLSSHSGRIEILSWDLAVVASTAELARRISVIFPEVSILVNNAGIARFTPFERVSEEELDLHLNTNVKAPYLLVQGLLTSLKKNKASIINISSYFSHRMLPGRPSTAYSLSKGAIDAFTKALAYEMGPHGIRVNAIAPGTVNTPLVQGNIQRLNDDGKQKFYDMIPAIYPLGRIGEPEDLGGIAVYLASEQSSWVTGSIFNIDGGLTTN